MGTNKYEVGFTSLQDKHDQFDKIILTIFVSSSPSNWWFLFQQIPWEFCFQRITVAPKEVDDLRVLMTVLQKELGIETLLGLFFFKFTLPETNIASENRPSQ